MSLRSGIAADEQLDVRAAAALTGRHPETIRRWVSTGRVAARREGNRLVMARSDIEAIAARSTARSLAEWAQRAHAARMSASGHSPPSPSAADLVLADRAERSG